MLRARALMQAIRSRRVSLDKNKLPAAFYCFQASAVDFAPGRKGNHDKISREKQGMSNCTDWLLCRVGICNIGLSLLSLHLMANRPTGKSLFMCADAWMWPRPFLKVLGFTRCILLVRDH